MLPAVAQVLWQLTHSNYLRGFNDTTIVLAREILTMRDLPLEYIMKFSILIVMAINDPDEWYDSEVSQAPNLTQMTFKTHTRAQSYRRMAEDAWKIAQLNEIAQRTTAEFRAHLEHYSRVLDHLWDRHRLWTDQIDPLGMIEAEDLGPKIVEPYVFPPFQNANALDSSSSSSSSSSSDDPGDGGNGNGNNGGDDEWMNSLLNLDDNPDNAPVVGPHTNGCPHSPDGGCNSLANSLHGGPPPSPSGSLPNGLPNDRPISGLVLGPVLYPVLCPVGGPVGGARTNGDAHGPNRWCVRPTTSLSIGPPPSPSNDVPDELSNGLRDGGPVGGHHTNDSAHGSYSRCNRRTNSLPSGVRPSPSDGFANGSHDGMLRSILASPPNGLLNALPNGLTNGSPTVPPPSPPNDLPNGLH
ncbi:hypothetical protein NA57DRAFT_60093 [Rhizodiscina lignyota]|uniref:Uncharacterized protein n=1 Tax=Rhizodiscina lignyota TaxID=1504668 RepID=A0A9P4I7P7_9PEZI|nr:hypothetical protein NA57DRAFT_60093 [Rhizodiscina lignyota]